MADPHWKILQFVKSSERYGAFVSIRNLCLELQQRGHQVTLGVFGSESLQNSMAGSGVRTLSVPEFNKFSWPGILRLRNLFRAMSPDIIHTHLSAATLTGTLAARFARIPVVSTVHGMNRKWTYLFADRIITVSEAGKQHLVSQGVSPHHISVAYNGIRLDEGSEGVDAKKVRSSLSIGPKDHVLTTISRADRGKGIQDGIYAVGMLRRCYPNLRYLIAGEGDYLGELRAQTRTLGLDGNVQFLGFRNDVYDLLAASDVFLFPSLKEAMGISIVEAMALRVPVVATKVGGIPEVVSSETGLLVAPSAPEEVAQACETLLNDSALRQRMGEKARSVAIEKFSPAASATMVEAAYRKLIR